MVSVYMTVMRGYQAIYAALASFQGSPLVRVLVENCGRYNAQGRRLHHIYGRGFDPWAVDKNLPLFIKAEMEKPFLGTIRRPWHEHVRMWRTNAKRTVFVKYEDLLQDNVVTLSDVLVRYTGSNVNEKEIANTVERYSFKKWAGRDPGTEDRTSFARKGIKGDWQNYFTPEARRVFDRYAGEMLIELGYEADHQWVDAE